MADFSLDLNEDQLQIQKWVHDFAEDVVRPAAHEWDEREETPWPIIEEAAKIGLYSLEFMRQRVRRPDRPHVRRSSARSCAGVTPASRSRSSAPRSRVSGHRRQRHARADRRVGAAVLRHARRRSSSARSRERARRRLRRELAAHRARSTTRRRTSGCSTAPRRGSPTAASPTCTWSSRRSSPSSKARGHASFVVPPGTPGPAHGPEVQEERHPRQPHRRGRPRRRARSRAAACSAARRSSTSASRVPARARARGCRRR